MKILMLSPLPPPAGGIATWTKKYLQNCKEYNIHVDIINTATTGKRVHNISKNRNLFCEVKRTYSIIKKLKISLKKEKYDLVHINTSCEKYGIIRDWICSIIVMKYQCKFIVHFRCNVKYAISKNNNVYFLKKLAKNAEKIIVLNKDSESIIESIYKNKSVFLPNYIEEDYANYKYEVRNNVQQITFIGRIQFEKGYKEILESAKHYPSISFNLVGPSDDEILDVIRPSNVIIKDELSLEDVKKELFLADIFLFPSYSEGFSNALLEAMAMGVPIIASDVGANKDMIENKGGIIVSPRNSNEIISAISQMMSVNVREQMSKWNILKVKKEYTIPVVMKKLEAIYERIIYCDTTNV